MIIKKVRAHKAQQSNANQTITLNCPPHILTKFREIIANSKLPGTVFVNPYTNEVETFPTNPNDFTARHLQLIARNEPKNTDGVMQVDLYENQLDDNQIASIRALVKATTISGITQAHAYGGYHSKNIKFENPEKIIVVDQAGLQWQGDFRNTGGMFFYPKDTTDNLLPENYADWQNEMFLVMYDEERSEKPSDNQMPVVWNGVEGCIDLDKVAVAIEQEFLLALDAVVVQSSQLEPDEKINFKFLNAGMGFFSNGLTHCDKSALEMARLQGIVSALEYIAELPEEEQQAIFGKVKRLELPFSSNPPKTDELIGRIETLTTIELGLEWGGTAKNDALAPREGYVNATTNCADPHAMIGNEGKNSSVDAALSENANLACFNPAYNENIQLREPYSLESKKAISGRDNTMSEIKVATEQYLEWMNNHATGFRLSHLYHGEEGKERAQNILNRINNGDSYETISQAVTDAFKASGTSQHSYSRFLIANLTTMEVLDNKTGDNQFSKIKDRYNIADNFKDFKARANEIKNAGKEQVDEKAVITPPNLG